MLIANPHFSKAVKYDKDCSDDSCERIVSLMDEHAFDPGIV